MQAFFVITFVIILPFPIVENSKTDKSFLDASRRLQNIVIKIDENINEQDNTFVDRIKKLISDTSESLFEATSNMGNKGLGVKFGNVSIIIPSSWKLKGNPYSGLHCSDAQIKIVSITSKDLPFTKQNPKCGMPGDYIAIPTGILNLTGRGRQIMREYVKLRYGVFSEEISKNIAKVFQSFKYVNSVCNQNIELEFQIPESQMIKCTDANDICHFKIKKNQNHNYSVMFDAETPSSKYFCDDTYRPHNKYAKNLQNKKCQQKSITSIILNHSDFTNVPSVSNMIYEPPNFNIIQTRHRKIILVLDISGSMADYIDTMKKAIKEFVNNMIEDTAKIGLVTFSDDAKNLTDMIPMNKKENRILISNIIDGIHVYGGTNIGHGLQIAVKVLGGTIFKNDTLDGTILLISDGENNDENEDMLYKDIVDVIITKTIQTNVVSYNQSDILLNKLTRITGGNFVHAKINSSVIDIIGRFARALESCDSKVNEKQVLTEKIKIIQKSGKPVPFLYLDSSMGNDRKVSIKISSKVAAKFNLSLTDEKQNEMKLFDTLTDNDKVVFRFNIPDYFKNGNLYLKFIRINYKRVKRSLKLKHITYLLDNITITDEERLFYPETQLSHSFVDMVNENTIITATVYLANLFSSDYNVIRVFLELELPNGTVMRKRMMDDGYGEDSIQGDLIFTKYILPKDISKKGVYNFKGIIEMYKEHSLQILRKVVIFSSLLVNSVSASAFTDRIPPAQMQEPIIEIFQNKFIKLKTIATGNDAMDGRISKYEIRIRSVVDYVVEKSFNAGPYEKIEILLDISKIKFKKQMEISIRGVDYNRNVGIWSPGVPLILEKL